MKSIRRPGWFFATVAGFCIAPLAAILTSLTSSPEAEAAWPWKGDRNHHTCGHPGCGPDHCLASADWGGAWYWMRSPEQERRVVMSLYNRYCVRCHGIDGRGIWDIPCVPDFTNIAWQASRPDPYRTRVILEGRGAVMPAFRGTLTLEEACAMARYLHTFVPGSEVSRPDLGTAATRNQPTDTRPADTPAVTSTPAPPSPTTPGPFTLSRQPVR
jgi:mono/diheme cytochrome c family protein